LRQKIELSSLHEVDVEDGNIIDLSTPHCFVLRTEKEDLYCCVESSEELHSWISELQWRIQATQRSIKYKRAMLETESDKSKATSHSSNLKTPKK
jgi:hypothetical protein